MAVVTPKEVLEAHKHSFYNRDEIEKSKTCGCFYCLEVFQPTEILLWTDELSTAICPRCGVDSVLGSASGYSLEPDFLKDMQEYWFSFKELL
ncbi:MAG: cytoplasmic protein [Spirochaetota bacterium]